jgi:hypothetical protein
MKMEDALMENTQATVRAYLDAQTAHYMCPELDAARICVSQYGCGWEDFDFDTQTGKKPTGNSKSTMRCPSNNCSGFIYSFVCSICSCNVCDNCHEIKRSIHKCDPNIVASIKAMRSETKPCPKCSVAIFKNLGCNQMFCTQCHVTFDWETLAIHRGHTHNPHYFEWLYRMRARGDLPQHLQPPIAACEQFITFFKLRSCFDAKEVEYAKQIRKRLPSVSDIKNPLASCAHYYVAFENLRQKIVHLRATSGNHAYVQPVDNRDLRVQWLVNEIDQAQFRSKVISRDFEYRRMICYCNVYLSVYQLSLIIFDNIYTFAKEKHKIKVQGLRKKSFESFLFDMYSELQNVLHTGNECLDYYDLTFGADPRLHHFSCHPYSDIPNSAKQN